MSTEQHEALKLADEIDSREWFSYTKAANTIRTLDALIVQMAEAMKESLQAVYIEATATEWDQFESAYEAATQYLKGPKT